HRSVSAVAVQRESGGKERSGAEKRRGVAWSGEAEFGPFSTATMLAVLLCGWFVAFVAVPLFVFFRQSWRAYEHRWSFFFRDALLARPTYTFLILMAVRAASMTWRARRSG